MKCSFFPILFSLLLIPVLSRADQAIEKKLLHLRNTNEIEWTHFPSKPFANHLEISFDLDDPSNGFDMVTLRQDDVKQFWDVFLNRRKLGRLLRDFNHQEVALPIPTGLLKPTGNLLTISTKSKTADDIRVGDIVLRKLAVISQPGAERLRRLRGYQAVLPGFSGVLQLSCVDADKKSALPCRFTITDSETGALVLLGTDSDDNLAVRTGVVYSLDGTASIKIAPGRVYRIVASRGFEYGIDEKTVTVAKGKSEPIQFEIRHEVRTPGLVSCDTHLHTFEFDRHGDCTLTERLIAVAGEGVELPVSTAHNAHIDYSSEAARLGADKWLTPVLGCEVTTKRGHFNSFPIKPNSPTAEHKLRPWDQLFRNIYATPGVKICILNHGRDLHGGYRPFAAENFDAKTGIFLNEQKLQANAMEVINCGAQISDPMQLVHDWMALLRSGHKIAAIGSSDTHTVNFTIAGQARTYLKCPDDDPGKLDTGKAVASLESGESLVSFGLLTRLSLRGGKITVSVDGPSWTKAEKVVLFKNGLAIKEVDVPSKRSNLAGKKFDISFTDLSLKKGDFLVAVATGPGITDPFWAYNPPYQATSPTYTPYVMGISAARFVK